MLNKIKLLRSISNTAFILSTAIGRSFILFIESNKLSDVENIVKTNNWLSSESNDYAIYILDIQDNKYFTGSFEGIIAVSTILLITKIDNWGHSLDAVN